MSKISPRSGKTAAELEERGPSKHPKKPKNAKEYNLGKGAKKRMSKVAKHKKSPKKR
ncbi:MAG: hypothetical protein P8Q49_01955 [Schleiferiaceae bacterium]|nr:hypothetical protein [Schleiferiaceae bacterium]